MGRLGRRVQSYRPYGKGELETGERRCGSRAVRVDERRMGQFRGTREVWIEDGVLFFLYGLSYILSFLHRIYALATRAKLTYSLFCRSITSNQAPTLPLSPSRSRCHHFKTLVIYTIHHFIHHNGRLYSKAQSMGHSTHQPRICR